MNASTLQALAKAAGCGHETVARWCREGRIHAKQINAISSAPGARGGAKQWRIAHAELKRYQRYGLLPLCPGRNYP